MKSGRNLLIPFLIMVVLLAGVVVFFVLSSAKDSSDTTDSSIVNALYVDISEVKSITVTSSDPASPQVCINVTNNEDGSLVYTYNGSDADPEENYSSTKMNIYLSVLTDYYNAVLIAENANLDEYGLSVPEYTEVIETVSGFSSKVSFGNISYSGEYVYICIDDAKTVYSVPINKYKYVSMKAIDFIETSVLNIDPSNLSEVEFIRKTDNLDITATCTVDDDGNVLYRFYDPFEAGSGICFDSLIGNVCSLDITSFIEISEDEVSTYKLDDPEFHFILTESNGTVTEIILSENIGGYYYGYILGNDKYFSISSTMIQNLEIPSVQYLESYISYYQASDISTLKGSYDGLMFEFKITTDSNGSISGDDSTVTLDGRNAKVFNSDGRSYCAVLFESFACMEIGGIDTSAVVNTSATPELILEYTTTQYEIHTIEFYKRSDTSYYVVKDGEYTKLFVYSKELFNDGGTDTYNYGVWAAYELLKTAIDENVNGVYDIPVTTEEAA